MKSAYATCAALAAILWTGGVAGASGTNDTLELETEMRAEADFSHTIHIGSPYFFWYYQSLQKNEEYNPFSIYTIKEAGSDQCVAPSISISRLLEIGRMILSGQPVPRETYGEELLAAEANGCLSIEIKAE